MNQDAIWDYYQNEAPESFSESLSRLEFLARQLRPRSKVLNIGIGAGYFEEVALKMGHDVYALDPIEQSVISLSERLHLGQKAKVGYGQAIPFTENIFDAVVVSEVIEHLTPEITKATLMEIRRVLIPGGLLIGTVPANEDLQKAVVVCPHCQKPFHRWGHLQSFTVPQMRMLLQEHFAVEQVYARPFFTWRNRNWKGIVVNAARWGLWRLGSHPTSEIIFFRVTNV